MQLDTKIALICDPTDAPKKPLNICRDTHKFLKMYIYFHKIYWIKNYTFRAKHHIVIVFLGSVLMIQCHDPGVSKLYIKIEQHSGDSVQKRFV